MKTYTKDNRFNVVFTIADSPESYDQMIQVAIGLARPIFDEHDPEGYCNDITIYQRIDIGYDNTRISFDMTKHE